MNQQKLTFIREILSSEEILEAKRVDEYVTSDIIYLP
jgi:hypothetical protein